jgi:hypothetical protein
VRAHAQGEGEPSPAIYQHALRDVIGRCLYGVDVNPMAAELCRVSLWLEALEPGKPLSFLDHHIRVGNSLVGATPELVAGGLPDEAFEAIEGDDKKACTALRNRNRAERRGVGPLFAAEEAETQARLLQAAAALEELPDDQPDDIRAKELALHRHEATEEYRHKKQLADAWCAAFVMRRYFAQPGVESTVHGITQGVLNDLAAGHTIDVDYHDAVDRLNDEYRFFHWHLAFPEVFAKGGFDCVLGNPPWDALSPDAKEFFSRYDPNVRFSDRDGQRQIIEGLLADPTIADRWSKTCRELYALVHFIKHSGRYRLFAPGNLGKGDFNVYRMFVELALSSTRKGGWAAQLAPEGLYNGANCMAIRQAIFETSSLAILYGFENANEVWFKDIDTRMKFGLYAAQMGARTEAFHAAFNIRSHDQLADVRNGRSLHLPVRLVKAFSPDALAVMELGSQIDIDIAVKMYAWPTLGDESASPPHRVYMAEIHMGNDRELFNSDLTAVPVYEGRMVDQYDYRAKGYRSGRGRAAEWEDLPFGRADKSIQPQWFISRANVPDKTKARMQQFRVAHCAVGSPTNERTLIACLVPPNVLCGHSVLTLLFEPNGFRWYYPFWIAVANSYVMDFAIRSKVSLNITLSIMDSLPFPRPTPEVPFVRALVDRSLRLLCAGPEMVDFWNELAEEGWAARGATNGSVPGETDDAARLTLRAEIDAIVARDVFGLSKSECEHILSTFPTQQRYQEENYGEFRSRRLILEAFDSISLR